MALSTRRFPVEQNVGEIVKETPYRWLKAAEIDKIFENHEKLHILAIKPQQQPMSGSFFSVKLQSRREFRRDGRKWSKKKDGKTIQESHGKLKVYKKEKLNCQYAYLEANENFQRRIYRMIEKGRVDIALFHYREVKEKRKRTNKVFHRSPPEARKAKGCQGSSSGNQLPLPPQTTGTSNLENIQGNVESAGDGEPDNQSPNDFLPNPGITGTPCELPKSKSVERFSEDFNHILDSSNNSDDITMESLRKRFEALSCCNNIKTEILLEKEIRKPAQCSSSGVAGDGCNGLPLLSETTNTGSTQVHSSNQLHLHPISTDTSNQNFSELALIGMQRADAGFFDTYYSIPLTGGGMPGYCNDFENQPLSHSTWNDFLPNPEIPNSPVDLLDLINLWSPS